MKGKRYIASLLLAVCLFALGGPSLQSLLCPCAAPHSTHVACPCCHHAESPIEGVAIASSEACCDDAHTLGGILYSPSSQDDERLVRTIQTADFEAVIPSILHAPQPAVKALALALHQATLIDGLARGTVGLRAPPATA
ncbi:MAG: hypothetical protein IJN98_07630 [Alistipes sp.]|nr:hypothetical protein [Alistipes sp.]